MSEISVLQPDEPCDLQARALPPLPDCRRAREAQDIVGYLAEYDRTLGDLRPEQVAMFVAARNLAPCIEGLEVPIASRASHAVEANLTEQETENVLDETAYFSEYLESRLPADEMDVSVTGSVEDLPRIFPTQWLLEEIQPEIFYAKLAKQELLVPQWQQPDQDARDSDGQIHQRELLEEQASAQATRQHAYVLLDTSRTMNDHDRRGTVARGLALAFLLHGFRQRARLNLRPFTAHVGELSSGISRDDFRAITERVIALPNAGQTRIQTALEQAVEDIRQAGPCLRAEIMLITDGISRITTNPLTDEKLHTFLLGDLLENEHTAGTISTLREWSTSFHRLWINRFAEILAPTLRDVQAAGRVLESLLDEEDPAGAQATRLRRTYDNVAALVEQFKSSQGKETPLAPELDALEALLRAARSRLARARESSASVDGSPAARGMPGFALFSASGAGDERYAGPGFWAFLRRLMVRLWQWARDKFQRMVRIDRRRRD